MSLLLNFVLGMAPKPCKVHLRLFDKGQFVKEKGKTMYTRGIMHLVCGISSFDLCIKYLRMLTSRLTKLEDGEFELWLRKRGKTLDDGRALLLTDADVSE